MLHTYRDNKVGCQQEATSRGCSASGMTPMTFSSPRPAYTVDAISPMRPTLPPAQYTEYNVPLVSTGILSKFSYEWLWTGLIDFQHDMLTAVYQADPPFYHLLPHLLCALGVFWIVTIACTAEYSYTSDGVVTIMPSAIFSIDKGVHWARHSAFIVLHCICT